MLRHRLVLGPLMLALLVGVFYLDGRLEGLSLGATVLPGGVLLLLVVSVLIVVVSAEIVRIFRAKGIVADPVLMPLCGVSVCGAMYAFHGGSHGSAVPLVATVIVCMFGLSLLRQVWRRSAEGAVGAAAAVALGATYLGLLPGFFLLIRRSHGPWVVAAVMVIPKCCDIGAYCVGRAIGRRKLIAWLSPGKTWEGLIGGVAVAAGAALGLAALGNHLGVAARWGDGVGQVSGLAGPKAIPLWFAGVAGGVFGLVGQAGDLAASLFKRDAGTKDSGQSVPGFGGVLDVVDSPLLVAPVAYWVLELATSLGS